jgi:putative transposase
MSKDMTNSSQKQALERFHLIRPFIEDGVPLVELAVHHTIALRTLQRWVKQYRSDGMAGLARKNRRDKGISRRLSTPLVELVEAMALETPRRSIATIHRLICDIAANRSEPSPSYHAVYNIVKAMNPALLTLAHEGSKVYNQTYDLLYRREAEAPNALWQADHTRLDILLLNDEDQPAKPWLSVILDDYSRTVAGYFLSFEAPCALQTALTLHQAIWRKSESAWPVCGVPQILYTDHGSDFISQHLEQVCADLKIRLIFSTVGKPRGRGRIERFFETVNQLLLCTLPGYSPAGSSGVRAGLRVDALEQAFRAFVIEHYHHTPHSATGKTPLARWSDNGFLPQLPESLEQLDLLLLTVAKPRRVQKATDDFVLPHRDGIRFQSLRYIDSVLAAYVGEAVTIRYNPRDMAEIRVFHQNRFLCRAVCQELAGETVSLKDITQARRQRQRDLQQVITQRRSLVDQFLKSPSTAGISTNETATQKRTPQPTTGKKLKRYEHD